MKKQNNNIPKAKINIESAIESHELIENEKHFIAINEELKAMRNEMATKKEIKEMEARIFRHFDVAVEDIESSLRGANEDQLSLLDNKKNEHEIRITKLEVRAGLRVK